MFLVIVQDPQQLTNKKALMQEAAMIQAMGIQNLTNVKNERFSEKSWKLEVWNFCQTFSKIFLGNLQARCGRNIKCVEDLLTEPWKLHLSGLAPTAPITTHSITKIELLNPFLECRFSSQISSVCSKSAPQTYYSSQIGMACCSYVILSVVMM